MQSTRDGGLVLIVEDNRNISEMVGEYLEGRGFEVDFAADGLDGYRLSTENSYDVIVLDLMLPRMDGIEVCKKLREEARKSTPVLMLTARDTLDEKLNGLSVGADDYLTKPFAIQELEARLRALIRRERRSGSRPGQPARHPRWHRTATVANRPAPAHDPDAGIAARGQPAGNRTRDLGQRIAGFGHAAQPSVQPAQDDRQAVRQAAAAYGAECGLPGR
jgi:DNA-binding response OmpR family regulator